MKWLDGVTENAYLSGMIQRASPVLEQLVDDSYKAFVKPLKDSGGWDAESAAKAKYNVANRFKVLWGADGLKKLAHILGAPETADDWIGGLVERAVSTRKLAGRATKKLKAIPDPT
jgi:hypothetical protein